MAKQLTVKQLLERESFFDEAIFIELNVNN